MTVLPDPTGPDDGTAETWGTDYRGEVDGTSPVAWDDAADPLGAPLPGPADEAVDTSDPVGWDVGPADADGVDIVDPEPAAGALDGDDVAGWFEHGWVDVGLLPADGATADDLPGEADIGPAARLLWERTHAGTPPPADDVVSVLRLVVETGSDEVDQRAARVLLGLLEGRST